ncbi:MAG: CPBP family intramembrane metalloprotease [Theionarchaea archaeon]|nr:MAG: hypothetical protein AYK18_09515 [Theionarchaea archaeon DG-70]MBU7009315.1 CPBP family intramembrane metalloprotease [Theionarchaea archaeon]
MQTIFFWGWLLNQSDAGIDVVDRLLEWSAAHSTLLTYITALTLVGNGLLIFSALIKRKWILEKLKQHSNAEQWFILSVFSTFIFGVSCVAASLGIWGLYSAGQVSIILVVGTILLLLAVVLSLGICLVTFLVLFLQLFIRMIPASPEISGEVNWGGTPVLVVAVAYFVMSFLLALVSGTAGALGGSLVFIVFPLFLVLKTYGRTKGDFGIRKPISRMFFLCLPLIVVLIFGNNIVYWMTEKIIGEFPLDELVEETISESPALMSIAVAVLGPIGEEFFFRGFAYAALKRKYGVKKGILFSSLFFGVYHVLPWQIPYAFVAGCILAFVYEKTESIYPPILFHVLNNFLAVIGIWT